MAGSKAASVRTVAPTSDKTGQSVVGVLSSDAPRALRADARRNHDQLLIAAGELFAERGIDVPLEEISRRAGVGIGTLYRHFPTRNALIESVYRREVEILCDGVDELIAQRSRRTTHSPRGWQRS